MVMEQFDSAKAARVWQRVQEREPVEPLRPENASLIRAASEQAARYRNLSRGMPGKYGEMLRDCSRQQQRAADCLRGICRLSGIPLPPGRNRPLPPEPVRQMLEQCCREERKLVEAYSQRMPDPEWGRVYGKLAAEAAGRCCSLLEILGSPAT